MSVLWKVETELEFYREVMWVVKNTWKCVIYKDKCYAFCIYFICLVEGLWGLVTLPDFLDQETEAGFPESHFLYQIQIKAKQWILEP